MKNMREYINLFETRLDSPDVEYTEKSGQITAKLSSNLSGKYTKLVKNLQRIDILSEELKSLQAEVKQQRREDVVELFDTEDAVLTRVVETKSAILTLSKDPKDRETVKYAQVLQEFEQHLTPELIVVLEALKKAHTSYAKVEPGLKYKVKNESVGDQSVLERIVQKVQNWLPSYDAKLSELTH